MSEKQNSIFDAISLIAKKEATKLGYDRTVKAVITNIENSIYKVSYQGSTFVAYNDFNLKLAVGDEVYVKVPGDNFSNRKIIEGRAEDAEVSKSNLIGIKVTPISINFVTQAEEVGVDLDKHQKREIAIDNAEYFKAYAAAHRKLQISAKFKIDKDKITSKNNYGLKVVCGTADGEDVEFIMDTDDFIGDPWAYSTPSPQSLVFSVDEPGYLTSIKGVYLFSGTGENSPTAATVSVSDVSIQFVEEIEVNKKNYVLTIVPSNGTILFDKDNKNETILEAQLWHMGQNIINTVKLQWFIQDSSATQASAEYVKEAGAGWKLIEGQTGKVLSVTPGVMGAPARTRSFKVLATIDSMQLVVDSKVTIYYQQDLTPINIITVPESATKQEEITGLKIENEDLIGFWYLDFNTAIQKELIDGQKSNSITILNYVTNLNPGQQLTFVCEAYDSQGYFKGYGSYTYTKDIPLKPTVVSEFTGNGTDIFHYDANGDISYLKYDKVYTISMTPRLQSSTEAINPTEYVWKIGNQIIGTNTIPSNSMISSISADSNSVTFTVNHKYNYYKDNNTLEVSFKYEDNDYVFMYEPVFMKDGDQGTNGTSYILIVKPVDKDYATLGSEIKVKAMLYRDGELYDSNPSVSWMPDPHNGLKVINGEGTAEATIQVPAAIPYKTIQNTYIDGDGQEKTEIIHQYSGLYVRAVCDINNNGVSWTISNYYPIDVVSENINNVELSYPSYVQYNSAGTRPTYDSDEKYFKINGVERVVELVSLTDDLLEVNGINRFYPTKNYSAQSQRAGLVSFTFNNKIYYHSIIYYINQYSNEFVNSWGGNEIQIDENGQYLIAPQVGAGKKNEDNTFTGVLMGTLINAGDKQGSTDDGLFGFQNGEQTFRLGADGNAYFKGTVEAGSGKIGGWSIDEYGNLYSNGEIGSAKYSTTLNAYGYIDTNYINATGGSIGDWGIGGGLYNMDADTLLAGGSGGIYAKSYKIWPTFNASGNGVVGEVGYIVGSDGKVTTTNIGIKATDGVDGAIVEGKNARVSGSIGAYLTNSTDKHGVYIDNKAVLIHAGIASGGGYTPTEQIRLYSNNGQLHGTWNLPAGSSLNIADGAIVTGLLESLGDYKISVNRISDFATGVQSIVTKSYIDDLKVNAVFA